MIGQQQRPEVELADLLRGQEELQSRGEDNFLGVWGLENKSTGPPGRGFSIGLTTLSKKNFLVTDPDEMPRNDFGNTDRTRRVKGQSKVRIDTYFATWNVRTMGKPGSLKQIKRELTKYKIKIAALQEIKWAGSGTMKSGDHIVFYSGGNDRRKGTGFLIEKSMKSAILKFNAINDRMCSLRVKARFFNITIFSLYAPIEDAKEEDKDEFYTKLVEEYEKVPSNDVKIICGDLNAKIGREEIFQNVIGKESLHPESNNNGWRVIDFATSKNMIVKSTWLQRKNIQKGTWTSPDGLTCNQIDHVLIDRRHASDIKDVRSCRGADWDSDHFLVRIKYRQKIDVTRTKKVSMQKRYNVEELTKNQSKQEEYQQKIIETFQETRGEWEAKDLEGKWDILKRMVKNTTEEVVGTIKKRRREEWFDGECWKAIEDRNEARKKMLQGKTRQSMENYREKRRVAAKECRKKKRLFQKQRIEEIEGMKDQRETRKFYQRVRESKNGYRPSVVFCKDAQGNLIGDPKKMAARWKEYFEHQLNGDIGTNDVSMNIEEEDGRQTIENDYEANESTRGPSRQEVNQAIKKLRNNKAPGEDSITAEMIKYGGSTVEECMFELINVIWKEEKMPQDWNMGIIHPVHKKGDKSECGNYRPITLLSIAYKVFTNILASRLEPFIEGIGDYQSGFRKNRATTDQIFTIRQIYEKCYEYNIQIHNLFIDYKQAFDSIKRSAIYDSMRDFQIPLKLINLVKMTLKNTKSKVKVQGELSEDFKVRKGVKQGDALSSMLFILTLERAMRQLNQNLGGTIMSRLGQCIAYADDLVIVSRNIHTLGEMYTSLEAASGELGLKINIEKTKYMKMKRNNVEVREPTIQINNKTFQRVNNIRYLGSLLTAENQISLEIRNRLNVGNRCYWALQPILNSRNISRNTKTLIYKTVLRPIVLYASETWTLTATQEDLISKWERKILRRIYGGVVEDGAWRVRKNAELYQLFDSPSIISRIKQGRVRWAGHVQRMGGDRAVKRVFNEAPGGRRVRGRPRKRWLDGVEEDLRSLGIRRWRRVAEDRDEWRRVVLEAGALHGL